MNYRSMTISAVISATVLVLAACGGGSSSSGGSSGGSGSNLFVKVRDGDIAYLERGAGQGGSMAVAISDFLINTARAQAGYEVTVWDTNPVDALMATGITDESGEVAFAVPVNEVGETYTVCVGVGATPSGTPLQCYTLIEPVEQNDVVVATVDVDGNLITESTGVEDGTDNLALFEDTNHPGPNTKIIICHKPDQPAPPTLSIDEHALEAHLNHGDTLGSCSGGDSGIAGNSNDDGKSDDDQQSADAGKPANTGKPAHAGGKPSTG